MKYEIKTIPIEQIHIEKNIREKYNEEDLNELAHSIDKNGLLSPIAVREDEKKGGYKIISGHRRFLAIKKINENFDNSFKSIIISIPATIIPIGDFDILQLIENIQRVDLTEQEKENALKKLSERGMSQQQIADELHKSKQWVSNCIAGIRIRDALEAKGVDTSTMTTRALAEARTVPTEDLKEVIEQAKKEGGSVQATNTVVKNYKEKKTNQQNLSQLELVQQSDAIAEIVKIIEEWKQEQESEIYIKTADKIIQYCVKNRK